MLLLDEAGGGYRGVGGNDELVRGGAGMSVGVESWIRLMSWTGRGADGAVGVGADGAC